MTIHEFWLGMLAVAVIDGAAVYVMFRTNSWRL